MISKETYEAIMENKEQLDSAIIFDRDFHYNLCVPSVCSLGLTPVVLTLVARPCLQLRLQDARAVVPAPDRRPGG